MLYSPGRVHPLLSATTFGIPPIFSNPFQGLTRESFAPPGAELMMSHLARALTRARLAPRAAPPPPRRPAAAAAARAAAPARALGDTPAAPPLPAAAAIAAAEPVALADLEAHLGPLSSAPSLPPPPPLVLVVSGPSGVGKDAALAALRARRPDLRFVVTATSRAMRPGEVHGEDYLFVSRTEFEAWIADGRLLEHAVVYGEYKGIPRASVDAALAAGVDVVLRVDVQGAAAARALLRPRPVTVFLAAGSEAALVARLAARKTEPLDRMLVRVATARAEAARVGEFDYVVVNAEGRLGETVDALEAILAAEKARVDRQRPAGGGDGDGGAAGGEP